MMAPNLLTLVPGTAWIAASLGISAIWLTLLEQQSGISIERGLMVAACAGVVAALPYRSVIALTVFGLILDAGVMSLATSGWVDFARVLFLFPPILLLVFSLKERPIANLPVPVWAWALFPVAMVGIVAAMKGVEHGSVASPILLSAGAVLASLGGFAATRGITGEDMIGSARHALRDQRWLRETARYLLLGRISGGLSHELSQSLNVITMANGNLGYILGRADVVEPYGQQLSERVRRIANNADTAAEVLGQFRWFGQEGGREGSDLSVGSALSNAVSATRAAARRSGVVIEVRGDALTHLLPLRHGTIEMMATGALLEIAQVLTARMGDGSPPERIVIEATTTETQIEILILCGGGDAAEPMASWAGNGAGDGIAQASYDLLSRLASQCGCELQRVNRPDDPVRFIIRLVRDMA